MHFMTPARRSRPWWLPLLLVAAATAPAYAQDPPARVARFDHIEGSVVVSPAGDDEWIDAVPNRPLTRGDRLWIDRSARAELHAGSATLRLDGLTGLSVVALDDDEAQWTMSQGALQATVRGLEPGENFELDTPNLALRARQPGTFRLDVDPARGTTRVSVIAGSAIVYGEAGQALALRDGQQLTFQGRSLAQLDAPKTLAHDGFGRWVAERERRQAQSPAARHVPAGVPGRPQLDAHGEWAADPRHGAVWFPHAPAANWAPYRFGRWDVIAPWGWTWIDDAPWGFATSHYGRWIQQGTRWGWVPGALATRPAYAPALVGFAGTAASSPTVKLEGGRQGVAWFALGPGEAWQPGYAASAAYRRNVNGNTATRSPGAGMFDAPRRAQTMTAVALEDFQPGRPVQRHLQRVAGGPLTLAGTPPTRAGGGRVLANAKPALVAADTQSPAAARPAKADRPGPRERSAAPERKAMQARERAQREAWQRQQQALSEKWRREHQAFVQRRMGGAPRPAAAAPSETATPAQRQGIPILRQR